MQKAGLGSPKYSDASFVLDSKEKIINIKIEYLNELDRICKLIYSIYGPGMPDLEYIQNLGFLAIKLGQVHALRIDFLSRENANTSQSFTGKINPAKRKFYRTYQIERQGRIFG